MGDEVGDLLSKCRPVHTVTLDAFEMSIYEITNAQYGTDDGTISTSKVNYWETVIEHPVFFFVHTTPKRVYVWKLNEKTIYLQGYFSFYFASKLKKGVSTWIRITIHLLLLLLQ
ncbi:hypothetical protein ES707_06816 [subsurface metagenome]